jgi:Tfp pilus assembly protein PilF
MGDKPDSQNGVINFLAKINTGVLGFIAFVSTVVGFVVKLSGKDDTSIWILSALVVCAVCLWLICFHYAFLQQLETPDKGTSILILPLSESEVKSQRKKERQGKRNRLLAIAGLFAIPLLFVGGFTYWHHLQNQPTKDIVILVADFESTADKDYFVTKTIFENLESVTEQYPDVKVKRVNKSFQESKVAREEGEKQKASIVIWGSYGKTKETVPISVNFELLKKPDYFPELAPEAEGKVRTAATTDLESFKLQTTLSQEMTYLTLITLGFSRYAIDDWDGTIAVLTNALGQVEAQNDVIDQGDIYFARAYSYIMKQNYEKAIADLTQVINSAPKGIVPYFVRGITYDFLNAYDKAIMDFTQVITLNPNYPAPYVGRGAAYYNQQKYEEAIVDFNQAVRLNPNYSLAFYHRGNAFLANLNYNQAISDYTKAIEINENWERFSSADAYGKRGIAYYSIRDFDRAIFDYTEVINLKPDSANTYYNRGLAHQEKGNRWKAIEDFQKVLELTQNSKLQKDAEQQLKKLGVNP